nr:formimidoylglutamase [Pseudopedobacter sp.]
MRDYLKFYKTIPNQLWTGRNDGDEVNVQRWHQRINVVDLSKEKLPQLLPSKNGIAIAGFACDEGVKRNKGRVGAKNGPLEIRKSCVNFPVHFDEKVSFIDVGDIVCDSPNLEESQNAFSSLIFDLLKAGYTPLLFGGGHEITFPHYSGIRKFLALEKKHSKLGVINFDAHFDLRKPEESGANSGTGFWQIAQHCKKNQLDFLYLPIGIQSKSNTSLLFETAKQLKVETLIFEDCDFSDEAFYSSLSKFLKKTDFIQLTIDLDVFQMVFAPGVSAPAVTGIFPNIRFFKVLKKIFESGKVLSFDISELNPNHDINHCTARLAASLAYEFCNYTSII